MFSDNGRNLGRSGWPIFSFLQHNMFEGLFAWKASLPCPGPYESLHRESKSTLASLSMFDGAKLDATAVLSPNFHASHALQWV